MYKVIKYFTDLQDNNHAYEVGSIYPRDGLEPTQERIDELASDKNRQGVPLIEAIQETPETAEEKPKRTRKKE